MLTNNRIIVVALCTALNISIGSIVFLLKLPIYMDMIGTILCALILHRDKSAAFFCSALAGVISFGLGGLVVNPFLPWFSASVVAVAAVSAYVVGRSSDFLRSSPARSPRLWFTLITYGILAGVVAAIVSAPVVVYLFGGVTGSGSAVIVAFFLKAGHQLLDAAILSGMAAEPVDKTIQLLAAVYLYRSTPDRFLKLVQ